MDPLTETLRVLRPYPHLYAFYDGRVPGRRLLGPAPNWLDDGAFELGIATYAIVDGDEALVYDAHISLAHATRIREVLAAAGHTRLTLVISHWHEDHVAGNAVFADCPIIAHALTAERLEANKAAFAAAQPPIAPLVMPNRLFKDRLALKVGRIEVELHHADIHSLDGVVVFVPKDRLLLAGDTLEDPITYVAEPDRLAVHRAALTGLDALAPSRILPNHGALAMIETGGYETGLIQATRLYLDRLIGLAEAAADDPLWELPLQDFAADAFATGAITYFAPYEMVHRRNLKVIAAAR
ncbi:MBL fold metallo-hydrolase [Arboricoccus pini]|nr:MBL fold metallo-hydrolase [Arboricoccus pini]